MKSVTTQTQAKSTESISDEPSVMQAPKSDTLDPMMALNEETMPSDNLQDSVARPSFRKSVRLATHELNIAPKLAVAALTEGDSLAMRNLRKRIRGFFGDDPQTSDAKGIEAFKSQVELEFRELKSGKTESDVTPKDISLLLRTLSSVIDAGALVEDELDADSELDGKLDVSELEGEDAEEVGEDLSNMDEADISDQDAEALLRDNVAEIEVVQEVVDWREYKQEEEYEIMSVRKLKEEEEEI